MKPIELKIDYKFNIHNDIKMVQGDVLPFEAIVTDNYEEVNLQGITVAINMLKSDDTFIIQTSGIVIEGNKIKFSNIKDFTRESGVGKIQIIIKTGSYEKFAFEIKVDIIPAAINEDDVPSENIIPVVEELNEAIRKADEWIESHPDITELDNKVNSNTNAISTINKELSTTKNNLTSNITKTNNNETEISKVKEVTTTLQNEINKIKGLRVDGTKLLLNNKLISDYTINYLWDPGSESGYIMSSGHRVTMSKSIKDTAKGVVLIWSAYTGGVMRDYNYMSTPIYKDELLLSKNQRVLLSTTGGILVTKQITFTADGLTIVGDDANNQSPNNGMALRRIIEM